MDHKTLMIGNAGGTGSGKTTLVRKLGLRFGDSVSVVCHDWYYRAQNGLSLEERAGQAIDCPQYDYTVHNRSEATVRVSPASVVVVEGILIFADPALRDMFDIRIFVDTDADIRILRRLSRDVKERGRSIDSVFCQYVETVKPMHEAYVEPSKKYAHLIVPEGGENLVALEMIFGRVEKHIRSHNEESRNLP